MGRKVSLVCGILFSLLYVGTDILEAMRWEGYSYTSQAASELRAIGSPVRPTVVPLLITYSLFVLAFGVSVWRSSRWRPWLPITPSERKNSLSSVPRAVLLAAVLGTALAYMSDDMLNLAIPSVARDLRATVTDAQWILNAYYVSLVSCVIAAGAIGDIVGHRRVFVGGILIFSSGAVLCASAPAVWLMVAARFVQGIGAAMLLAAGLALVTYLSPPESRSSAVGRFLGLVAAVPAVGPFASGALVDLLSWRWLFVVPLALPVVALALTWLLVPETPRANDRRPDLWGAAVAFATLGAFSVALIEGAAAPTAPLPLVAFAVALIGGASFVLIERRVADPMLPLRFFQRRRFLGGNLAWLLGCMTSWGAVFFVAVMLQATLRQPPMVAGLILTPIYLVMMVGAPLAGRVADRIGPRWPILLGLGIYAGGLLLLSRIGPTSTVVPDVVVAILVFAAGMAVFTAPLATATMSALDDGEQGVASGMNNAMGQLAGLLGVVILPAIAGLAGVGFGDPAFAVGYGRALGAAALIAITCIPIAAWSFNVLGAGLAEKGGPGTQKDSLVRKEKIMTSMKAFIKRHPVLTYFALTFAISSGGLLIAIDREGLPLDARNSWIVALALFAGPSVAGPLMTGLVHGRAGLRELIARLLRWRVSVRWYSIALLTTPLLVIPILLALSLISSVFLPDVFTTDDVVALLLVGLVVGGIGGFSEELGWTGFAVPTVRPRHGLLTTGLIVGAMWAAWHVPVTFLSTVSPSGAVSWSLLLPPLCFYVAVLPAYRVLMVWVYDHTESLLVAMLMHTSLAATTFVILLPPATGVALIAYYLVLAAVLWVVVAAVVVANRRQLSHPPLRTRVA